MKNWSNPEVKNLALELTEEVGGYIENENGVQITSDPERSRIVIPTCKGWRWFCILDGKWSDKTYANACEAWKALIKHLESHCCQDS